MSRGGNGWTPASLTERLGGDEQLARELVHIFLAEYDALLQAVLTHVEQRDVTLIRRAAHALRGTVTNFVDEGPTATALALERAATELRFDDVTQLATQLQLEVEALATAMRRFNGADPCAS